MGRGIYEGMGRGYSKGWWDYIRVWWQGGYRKGWGDIGRDGGYRNESGANRKGWEDIERDRG